MGATHDLVIRDARLDDAEALAALIGQLGYPTSATAVAGRVDRLRKSDADRLVVAELGGRVVGLACLHTTLSVEYDQPAAKLSAIVVDEQQRRRGIGRRWFERWRPRRVRGAAV